MSTDTHTREASFSKNNFKYAKTYANRKNLERAIKDLKIHIIQATALDIW